MSEMIDRVATAICVANASENNDYMWMARAAIEAMREPTASMLGTLGLYYTNECDDPDFRSAWQAMIDEALR